MYRTLRIFVVILLYFSSISITKAQDVDTLGNIWIITLDKSRSMTEKGFKSYVYTTLLSDPLFSKIDFSKDRFVFYESGLIRMAGANFNSSSVPYFLKRENYRTDHFYNRFIRKRTKGTALISLNDKTDFKNHFQSAYGHSWSLTNFPYATSFVSLIQPLTLASFLEDYKSLDLSQYDSIILCSITDDADQNDQWLTDYKTIRKFVPNKQKEIDSILNTLIFNPFNSKSTGLGEFSEVFPPIEKVNKPKLFANSYTTKQGLVQPTELDNTVVITTSEPNIIDLRINSATSQHHIIKLDSVIVNGQFVNMAYPFVLKKDSLQKIVVKLNTTRSNDVSIYGTGQQIYTDDLLGKRIQKVTINEKHSGIYSVNSMLHHSRLKKIGLIALALLLLWIAYVIYKLHRPKCIIIGPSGERTIIKNGFKYFQKKKKIQYAGFTKQDDSVTAVQLKDHFITNDQIGVTTNTEQKWITIIAKKSILLINDIDKYTFEKRDEKYIQGIETDYHEKIRKKYGNNYIINFIPYPTSDTTLNFTIADDTSQNEYNIAAAVITGLQSKHEIQLRNEQMISNVFLENKIPSKTSYILLCNKIQEGTNTLLYINLIRPYSLKTFLPIQILKHYKILLNDIDNVETIINTERVAIEKELKRTYKKKIKVKAYFRRDITDQNLVAINYPLFPVNLSLCSNEETQAATQLEIFNSISYDREAVANNALRLKVERPSNVSMDEAYSIQLLWHPHAAIYNMHITDRKVNALNGENYLDLGNPDAITLHIQKNNDQYIIKCQGHTLQTNVLAYYYKPTYNEL